jgi:hypothetical protein
MPINVFGSSGLKHSTNDADQMFKTLSANLATKVSKSGDILTGKLNMNGNAINSLGQPTSMQDAVTKNYVDQRFIKNNVGYIPDLISNTRNKSGFVVSTLSESGPEYAGYLVFNSWELNVWYPGGNSVVPVWIKIRCPEPIRIYKIALRGKVDVNNARIYDWKLQGSTDDTIWSDLYIARSGYVGSSVRFFNIDTAISYSYYRIFIERAEPNMCISYFQLYTLDPILIETPAPLDNPAASPNPIP